MELEKRGLKERIILIANELKIDKTGYNTYSEYFYLKPDDLSNALKPLLLKYRIFDHFEPQELDDGRTRYTLRLEDFDSEAVIIYTMTVSEVILKGANNVQSKGAQRTYVKRYLLMTAFDIAEDSDDPDNSDVSQNLEDAQLKEPKTKTETGNTIDPKPANTETKPKKKEKVLICEKCTGEIIPTPSNSVEEVIQIGKDKYGKQLCAKCIRELNAIAAGTKNEEAETMNEPETPIMGDGDIPAEKKKLPKPKEE